MLLVSFWVPALTQILLLKMLRQVVFLPVFHINQLNMHWKCQETEFNATKMYQSNLATATALCKDKCTVKNVFHFQTQESSLTILNPTYLGENMLVNIFFICSTAIHKGCCKGACDVMDIWFCYTYIRSDFESRHQNADFLVMLR